MPPTTQRLPGLPRHDLTADGSAEPRRKALVACGMLYSVLYIVANDVIAATLYGGYSRMSQAVSELSATGAPSAPFLAALGPVFSTLLIAFGFGVWRSAHGKRALRVTGAILVTQGVTAFLWLLARMSKREDLAAHGGTTSDALHIVLSVASVVFILSQMAVAAGAFGRAFRLYSVVTILVFIATATLTFAQGVRLEAGEPTAWLGLVERVMLGAWLLWMAVLAARLLPRTSAGVTP